MQHYQNKIRKRKNVMNTFGKMKNKYILGSMMAFLACFEVRADGPKDQKIERILARANARAQAGEDPAVIERDMNSELRAPEYVVTNHTKRVTKPVIASKPPTPPPSWDIYGNAETRRLMRDDAAGAQINE
jgi:hypothetical protein